MDLDLLDRKSKSFCKWYLRSHWKCSIGIIEHLCQFSHQLKTSEKTLLKIKLPMLLRSEESTWCDSPKSLLLGSWCLEKELYPFSRTHICGIVDWFLNFFLDKRPEFKERAHIHTSINYAYVCF